MIKSVVREWDEEEEEWVLADTQWDEEEQEWVPLAEWEPEGLISMLLGEDDEEESVENVFCPTGPGGGVDASCSPGKGGSAGGIHTLPEDHGKYFKKEVAAKAKYAEVPIGSLQATRAREDGIKNANGHMRDAYDGKNTVREPISVVKDGDGYRVLDGNSTFANAKRAGWKTMPVQVFETEADAKAHEKQQKDAKLAKKIKGSFTPEEHALPKKVSSPHETEEATYAASALALPSFNKGMDTGQGIDKALGAKSVTVSDREELLKALEEGTGPLVIMSPLKGHDRANEKVNDKLGGDWKKINDIVRGTVVVDTAGELPDAIKIAKEEMAKRGWTLAAAPKDRITNPEDSGYRDIQLKFKNEKGDISEMQFNTRAMMLAKEGAGHILYEELRKLLEQKTRTSDEMGRIRALESQSRHLYQQAWKD